MGERAAYLQVISCEEHQLLPELSALAINMATIESGAEAMCSDQDILRLHSLTPAATFCDHFTRTRTRTRTRSYCPQDEGCMRVEDVRHA